MNSRNLHRPILNFAVVALLSSLLACSPSSSQSDPYQYLTGEWEITSYDGPVDFTTVSNNLFVRIGPCDSEASFCKAALVPFDKAPEEVLALLDNNLELDFHLRDEAKSKDLASELGFELPQNCSPCFTLQDDIHEGHIYAGQPLGDNTMSFSLVFGEASEAFTLKRILD